MKALFENRIAVNDCLRSVNIEDVAYAEVELTLFAKRDEGKAPWYIPGLYPEFVIHRPKSEKCSMRG